MSSAWETLKAPDGANPWTRNAWDPPKVHVNAPAPRARTPRLIPEQHELFTVQRHALDVLHDVRELEHLLGHPKDRKIVGAIRRIERDAENTYRVIRTWLENYAS